MTLNNTRSSCCDNISKITLFLSKLGFVIHAEKSTFNPCQEIEYLGFVINSKKNESHSHQLKNRKYYHFASNYLLQNRSRTGSLQCLVVNFIMDP